MFYSHLGNRLCKGGSRLKGVSREEESWNTLCMQTFNGLLDLTSSFETKQLTKKLTSDRTRQNEKHKICLHQSSFTEGFFHCLIAA